MNSSRQYSSQLGSRIFILRTGVTQVYVHRGTSYAVLDHDGTDGVIGTDRLNPGLILPYDEGARALNMACQNIHKATWTS